MTYEVRLHREARRFLLELPDAVYRRVYDRLLQLQQQPRPREARKLTGHEDLWRLRVGRYRVIYHIDYQRQVVMVLRVALRTESTYRDL